MDSAFLILIPHSYSPEIDDSNRREALNFRTLTIGIKMPQLQLIEQQFPNLTNPRCVLKSSTIRQKNSNVTIPTDAQTVRVA